MRLIPYVRGEAPGQLHGVDQEVLDAILGSYGDQTFYPSRTSAHVRSSTIISWESDIDGLELSEDQIIPRLEMANYLAFSALSQRRFCSHYEYCNSDGYQVVAQRFSKDRPGDTTLTTRRRDGGGQHYVGSAEVPRFIRPHHVDGRLSLSLDAPLVIALLGLPDGLLKDRVDEAIDVSALSLFSIGRVSFQSAPTLLVESKSNSAWLFQATLSVSATNLPRGARWIRGGLMVFIRQLLGRAFWLKPGWPRCDASW